MQEILAQKFPAIRFNAHDVEDVVLSFALFTRQCAQECRIGALKECLDTAQELYQGGNTEIKTAIERVYMPAIKNLMQRNSAGGKLLKIYLPFSLYHLYIAQAYKM